MNGLNPQPKFDSLNPTDQRFIRKLNEQDRLLENLNRTRQQNWGDWYEWNPALFTFDSTDSTFNTSLVDVDAGLEVDKFFQVGDKVRINQSGLKYFYIIEIDTGNNQINLSGGDDFLFTNASFTSFGTSRVSSPSGHPLIFDFSTSAEVWTQSGLVPFGWVNSSSVFTGGDGSTLVSFYMQGSILTYIVDIGSVAMPANKQSVLVTTPFIKRAESSIDNKLSGVLSFGSDTGGRLESINQWIDATALTPSGDFGFLIFPRNIGNFFTAGTWGFVGNLIVSV